MKEPTGGISKLGWSILEDWYKPIAIKMKKDFLDAFLSSGKVEVREASHYGLFVGLPVIIDETIKEDYELVFRPPVEKLQEEGPFTWSPKA